MIRLSIPSIDVQEEKAISTVLKSGFLVQGKNVASFEEKVAHYLGINHAVAVSSGTSALHLALLGLGIGPGDEVIVPDYTFPATANVVELVGAKLVFIDIEPSTFNIDPHLVEKAITKKTKAIMPVHLFGQSADMSPLMGIAKKYQLKVIEDAACVLGAEYKGRKCATYGDAGCFSFHPRKIITTGEGGMVVTNNKAVADRLRALRNHGLVHKNNKFDLVTPGFNYRMTEMQAAIGLVQMKKLEALVHARRKAAGIYSRHLRAIEWVKTPETPIFNSHVFQSYIIQVPKSTDRDRLIVYLRKNGIEANIGTYAMHRLSFYKDKYRLKAACFPVTEKVFQSSVALPLFEYLSDGQIKKIAAALRNFI